MELIIRAIFTVSGGGKRGVGRGCWEGAMIMEITKGEQQRKLSVGGC